MPRKDFISDSLINMSDRFKRHYDEFHNRQDAGTAEKMESETYAVSENTPDRPRLNERVELPVLKSTFDYTEIERERRDLEGRLLRDLAFVEAEQEMISRRQNAAAEFYAVLQRELENLRVLDKNAPQLSEGECRRRTDALRAAYFKAAGRFSAIISARSGGAEIVSANASAAGENDGRNRGGAVAVVSGMIAAALIIAGTLIFIFT